MKINVYEHKGFYIAEIDEVLHSQLMKYWDEDHDNIEFAKDIELPIKGVHMYLCYIEKDKSWDAICVMETDKGVQLFGEAFNNKEYALKWLVNDYYDTAELLKQDRRNNPLLDEVERLRELIDACVDHIINFEDEEAENVLHELGFFDTEIKEYLGGK